MNAVARSVCTALLRELAGFRGYPKDGENRFIEVLQEVSLSVDHARAIILSFEENFPTIREIRDVAMNLRLKFQPALDQRADWEAEYGKPQPFSVDVPKNPVRADDALWHAIIQRDEFKGPGGRQKLQATSWTKLAVIARELGFEDHAKAWERSQRYAG